MFKTNDVCADFSFFNIGDELRGMNLRIFFLLRVHWLSLAVSDVASVIGKRNVQHVYSNFEISYVVCTMYVPERDAFFHLL